MDINSIKKLRNETGAGVMQVKRALEDADGDYEKAKKEIMKKGLAESKKRSEREASQGLVYSYIHNSNRVGVLLEINCETDFVAKTDDFNNLAKEVSLQIVGVGAKDVDDLLSQEYIRDASKKISDLVAETIAKTGENIKIKRFTRYALGE